MSAFLRSMLDIVAPGFEKEAHDEAESFSLEVDGHIVVDLSDEGDGVIGLYCVVWEFQDDPPHWLLLDICEANYGCAGTNGATLGMDLTTRSVLLTRLWPCDAENPQALKFLFDLFVETALHYQRRFESLLLESCGGQSHEAPGGNNRFKTSHTEPQFGANVLKA